MLQLRRLPDDPSGSLCRQWISPESLEAGPLGVDLVSLQLSATQNRSCEASCYIIITLIHRHQPGFLRRAHTFLVPIVALPHLPYVIYLFRQDINVFNSCFQAPTAPTAPFQFMSPWPTIPHPRENRSLSQAHPAASRWRQWSAEQPATLGSFERHWEEKTER